MSSSMAASMRKSPCRQRIACLGRKMRRQLCPTGRTKLDVERPANPRRFQPFHAPGTSRLSNNNAKINQGPPQNPAKLRAFRCNIASAPDAESLKGALSLSNAFPVTSPTGYPRILELEKAQRSIIGECVMLWVRRALRWKRAAS